MLGMPSSSPLVPVWQELTDAGETLFRDFFRVAGGIALVAVIPAMGMKLRRPAPSPTPT